ncbi:MAG: hypothetical protein EZS28_021065 [Streblomastix strix]|uniref:Uncharacterized protein n=1 Tax=Streblomastix strix TaxID=222440 RepID=A0A5J4VLF0_9EUKA|nr:MAG: hypothetical protein EZS28_021065 [Streblomastix strix]
MYDQNWYNSGDAVPDQITPASDATPLSEGTATAGVSTEYSRGDHVHPINITITISPSYSASGSVGSTNYYARNDHSHLLNIITSIPSQDIASRSVGTTNFYARNDHQHPINLKTDSSIIPIVNGVCTNGTSAFYAGNDHVHPQQLQYDGNITATKFIKTSGTGTDQTITRTIGNNGQNQLGFTIVKAGQDGQADRGLQIIADGNTLSFNGQVIVGTGANNSATNGSVNYSAGNPILQGASSLGAEGGFYSSGTDIFWRADALQFDPYYQEQ